MEEHFGVTTKGLRWEWDAAEQAILEEQGSRVQPRPDEQAQQGPSACSLEGKSISQVHQMFADLICAEIESARDATRGGKAATTGRQHPPRGDEQPSESIDSTFHTRNSVVDGSTLRECT